MVIFGLKYYRLSIDSMGPGFLASIHLLVGGEGDKPESPGPVYY